MRVLPDDDEACPRAVYHHSEDVENTFNGDDTDEESELGVVGERSST